MNTGKLSNLCMVGYVELRRNPAWFVRRDPATGKLRLRRISYYDNSTRRLVTTSDSGDPLFDGPSWPESPEASWYRFDSQEERLAFEAEPNGKMAERVVA